MARGLHSPQSAHTPCPCFVMASLTFTRGSLPGPRQAFSGANARPRRMWARAAPAAPAASSTGTGAPQLLRQRNSVFKLSAADVIDRVRPSVVAAVTPEDRAYMRQALELARRALGQTHPNPAVGCVIVKDGQVRGVEEQRCRKCVGRRGPHHQHPVGPVLCRRRWWARASTPRPACPTQRCGCVWSSRRPWVSRCPWPKAQSVALAAGVCAAGRRQPGRGRHRLRDLGAVQPPRADAALQPRSGGRQGGAGGCQSICQGRRGLPRRIALQVLGCAGTALQPQCSMRALLARRWWWAWGTPTPWWPPKGWRRCGRRASR